MAGQQPSSTRGVVVAYVADAQHHASEHERCALLGFAQRIAALRGERAAGFHDPAAAPHAGHVYFVPSSTLTSRQAAALGIAGFEDLFGGVVPHAFVGTKAISHPLVGRAAPAVPGWNERFAQQVAGAVLAGYTVFARSDARTAAHRLLARGPVRIKPVRASAGAGQSVVRDTAGLDALLAGMDDAEIAAHGLVLEEHLDELKTFSIGQVRVADLTASYFGVQRTTTNNKGARVFGGSDLDVVRGDFPALSALEPGREVAQAIALARRYDAAAQGCFPGFYASRSNYDVLLGRDAAGVLRCAVLEQSWRVGGATGAEIAALEVFRAEPRRQRVRTSCFEVFGDSPPPPAHATVYFRGDDPAAGRLTKYTLVRDDDDAG